MNFGFIGDFLNSLFGGGGNNQKKQQQQPQNQPQQSAPAPVIHIQTQPQDPIGIRAPQPLTLNQDQSQQQQPNQPPQIGGVVLHAPNLPQGPIAQLNPQDQAAAQHIASLGKDNTAFITAAHNAEQAQAQAQHDNSFWGKVENILPETVKGVGSLAAQTGGILGDTAIQGGSLLSQGADAINPTLSPQQKAQAEAANIASSQQMRDALHGVRDFTGAKLAGDSGADQDAGAIANGHATLGGVMNVAGTALNNGLAASSLDPATPGALISKLFRPAALRTGVTDAAAATEGGVQKADEAITSANQPSTPPVPAETPKPATPPVPATAPAPKPVEEPITSANQPAPAPVQPPVPVEAPKAPVPPVETAPAPVGKLGTITRDAVRDGSINTPEGIDKAVADTTTAAKSEAEAAGDTIENIIKKGQAAWEKSRQIGHDLTEREVMEGAGNSKVNVDGDPSFTPAQQKVYKDYSQELATLRDRSGHSLKGGDQGAWYGPRQFLDEEGASRAYNPSLVNELHRTGTKVDSEGNNLDYSTTPHEHYIRRYANASDAATQRFVDAAENMTTKGPHGQTITKPTGVTVPEEAKTALNDSLKQVTELRDEADRLGAKGDMDGAKAALKESQSATNKAFNDFMSAIPGKGAARNAALRNVKELRGTYEQSLMQTLTLSNVVNRVADQGTKIVEGIKAPFVRGAQRVINPIMKNLAMDGTEANTLNTSKEALQAAKEYAQGTLGRQIGANARATISHAGVGRNPLLKGLAKVDATIRAGGAVATESGDLGTRNAMEALRIGASRPEAKGLKTVEDYKKYFNDYSKTQKYKDDLTSVEKTQNPKIGLAGGEVKKGGTISNAISKYFDNGLATAAEHIKPGLGKNRLVREANDYVKGNITGYAGVTSRVLGSVADAAIPIRPLKAAIREAGTGDPAAVARATNMASHAVVDTLAAYGTAAGTAALLKSGVIGYTGASSVAGSNSSAYNKDNGIPSNQWYVNVGGKRIYFDPARATGAPGVAADLVGGALTSKSPPSAAESTLNQVANQAGGNSLPQTYMNFQTALANPSASTSAQKRAGEQVQQTLAPATGIFNNVANWTDGTKRAPTNFVDDLKSNLPVLRSQTPAAKDSAGNPLPNTKQISGGSSLFSVGRNTDAPQSKTNDPVASEITRLHNAGIDVTPTAGNTNSKDPNIKPIAGLLLKDSIYKSANTQDQAKMLKSVLDGTNTKGIQPSLGNDDKQALLDAKLLGSAKTKAQVDSNNDFAAKYETARYNNAKAAGTLDPMTDDNLQDKSGLKYKMVQAQVNKAYGADTATKLAYKDTSAAEWKKMLNPNDTADYNPDLATKLYKYDQALTAKGVSGNGSDTSKLKYDLPALQAANAKKAAGSGKLTAAQKSFKFSNLPSTLMGVTKATGSGAGSYAAAAPLFTPIASLKTPTTAAAIPKGRSISITQTKQI